MAMTVAQLSDILEDLDPDMEVVLAIQPSYPFEHSIDEVLEVNDGKVYTSEGGQNGYLGSEAREALGW